MAAFAAASCCLLLASCTDFKKAWAEELEKAGAEKAAPHDLTGAWEGTWTSKMNGHNGKLRCIVTKQKDGQYEFHYWAQWQRVLSGSFTANYKVVEKGEKYTVTGEKDLGKLGGKFTHKGTATSDTFTATYKSDVGDHGVFELKRPKVKSPTGRDSDKE